MALTLAAQAVLSLRVGDGGGRRPSHRGHLAGAPHTGFPQGSPGRSSPQGLLVGSDTSLDGTPGTSSLVCGAGPGLGEAENWRPL